MAFSMTLDIIIDVCSKRRVMKQIFARVFICVILMFTSCMHMHFSLNKDSSFRAPIVIKEMGSILMSAVIMHQLIVRSQGVIPTKYYYVTFYCAVSGRVVRAYDALEPALYDIGKPIIYIASTFAAFLVMRHIYLVCRGKLVQDWYDKWQQTAFEVLFIVYTITLLSYIFLLWTGGQI
jgi:hypothetical protein